MHDRGIIKWMPFNSVVSSKEIINSILKDKSKIIWNFENCELEVIGNIYENEVD